MTPKTNTMNNNPDQKKLDVIKKMDAKIDEYMVPMMEEWLKKPSMESLKKLETLICVDEYCDEYLEEHDDDSGSGGMLL